MVKTTRNNPNPPADDLARAAVSALDAGEDPGEFSVRDVISSLRQYLNVRRVTLQSLGLGIEWLRILAGNPGVPINPQDSRFRDPAWSENPVYRRLGQGYLAFCRAMEGLIDDDDGDWRVREGARFAVEVLTSTLAPTNTLPGNPAALKRAFETGGMSLVDGARNWVHDLRHNGGLPSQVDAREFEVGRNLACTPGAVVLRNDQLELLQYRPVAKQVYEIPVLIITPQINKYYFLDLAPGRSFVEYLLSRGFQPFMVSWKNPSPADGQWDLGSYCAALSDAIEAIREITGSERVNTFGFCAGGITMTALLGCLAQKKEDPINAVSYAVTLLDFSEPAMIGMFQSRPLLRTAKARSRKKGIYAGKDMASLFTWFRPNDLIWNYWVNNYLMGKQPPSFDILAWNADTTNLPGGLHCDFLDIYGRNLLARGKLDVLGCTVNPKSIAKDSFVTGAVNDHLTPWAGCYRTTQMLGGRSEFVLSNAGHVASLVNPPGNPKSSYFTGPSPGPDPKAWRAGASQHTGSWWEYWVTWAGQRSGKKRKAPATLGSEQHPQLVHAPGTYIFG